jgi:predicted acetyltransferase
MNIRPARRKDIESVSRVIATSFLLDYTAVKKSIERAARASISDFIVAEANRQILGCLKINPFELYMRGTKLKMGGIGGVAVLPEHRRKGIAEELMNSSILRMAEEKYPVSILYPFQHKFYRKFGWEFVGGAYLYDFSTNNLPSFEERQFVRRWTPGDRSAILSVYAESIVDGSCALARNAKFWKFEVFPKFSECYVYDDGSVRGYLVYDYHKGPEAIDIFVRELIILTPQAYRGILGFLSSLGEQVAAIKYLAPVDEPVHDFLKEPRSTEAQRIVFEYKKLATFCSGFMLRVVDLKAALNAVRNLASVNGEITIHVQDKQNPGNSEPVRLSADGGTVRVYPDTGGKVDLETDIRTFSQLYAGSLTAEQAFRADRVKGDASAIKFIDSLLRTRPPFIHQFDFF